MHPGRPRVALSVLGAFLMLAGCGQEPAPSQNPTGGFVPDTKPPPPVRWADALVPQGTAIPLTANKSVSSASSHVGDLFSARVAAGIVADSKLAIPEGATIEGYVAAITPPGPGSRGGTVTLAFKVVSTQTGASAPIAAHITGGKNWRGSFSMLAEGEPFNIALDQPLNIKVRQ